MRPGGPFRDVLLAAAIVGGVLGVLFLYTGVWPPMVVVESGSMMHVPCVATGTPEVCDPGVGYGKFGTIDPGDMVFVKSTPRREDVTTMAEAAAKDPAQRNYGKPGDVVVYFSGNIRTRTPIIHRAIAYVEAQGVPDPTACERTGNAGSATYTVFWEGTSRSFRAADGGIYLPSMGFGEPSYRPGAGYKPCWSGFITKGDNPVTNVFPDQATPSAALPRQPVRLDWLGGKAVGELPWFGLIKLALSSQPNYVCALANGQPTWRPLDPACDNGRAPRILNAYAPTDLWAMLGLTLAIIAIAPLAYDLYVIKRRKAEAAPAPSMPGEAPASSPAEPASPSEPSSPDDLAEDEPHSGQARDGNR
jgi:signal peptidase I